jgi:probable HAF family extracellular repeat protein
VKNEAVAINAAGQIVGNYNDSSGGLHGFLYSGGVYTTIDAPLGAQGTVVYGINARARSSGTINRYKSI